MTDNTVFRRLAALAPLAAIQAIAQLFLIAAGATVVEASLTVALLACLAPMVFPAALTVYRQAFTPSL